MTSKVTNGKATSRKGSTAHVSDDGAANEHTPKVAQRDWLDGFEEPPAAEPVVKVHEAQVVQKSSEELFDAEVLELDREIFHRSATNVAAAMRYAEVEPDEEGQLPREPPEDWVKEYGAAEAKVMWRIACLGNVPKAKMPAGMHVASQVYVGMVKARSEKKERPVLNLTMNSIEISEYNYPEKLV